MKEINIFGDVNWGAVDFNTNDPRSIIRVYEIKSNGTQLLKTYNRKYVGDKKGKKDMEQIATLWTNKGHEINVMKGFGF
jgi:hypothetical protein